MSGLFSFKDMTTSISGKVYLVGAGPGDPDLISVRGLRLLQRAEVLLFDRLVHPDLLDAAPARAERIYVGKTPGHHVIEQELINEILIERARRGKEVVRLKGGDPFVFGRGGEECLALQGAGIPFEIVPGITSAVSVPAYAGIPVTHRDVSPLFTVVTGHTCDIAAEVEWRTLAHVGTLVVLMGLSRLEHIASELIAGGRSSDTPVAVIRAGTTREQEVVEGSLANIAERARHVRPPATVVIGEVVALRSRVAWFDAAAVGAQTSAHRASGSAQAFAPGNFEAEHTYSSI